MRPEQGQGLIRRDERKASGERGKRGRKLKQRDAKHISTQRRRMDEQTVVMKKNKHRKIQRRSGRPKWAPISLREKLCHPKIKPERKRGRNREGQERKSREKRAYRGTQKQPSNRDGARLGQQEESGEKRRVREEDIEQFGAHIFTPRRWIAAVEPQNSEFREREEKKEGHRADQKKREMLPEQKGRRSKTQKLTESARATGSENEEGATVQTSRVELTAKEKERNGHYTKRDGNCAAAFVNDGTGCKWMEGGQNGGDGGGWSERAVGWGSEKFDSGDSGRTWRGEPPRKSILQNLRNNINLKGPRSQIWEGKADSAEGLAETELGDLSKVLSPR
ncbi:hypothetical protein FB451DRAFT_1170646 [Mycena latifolia]|nr:hypothetical protein FB451DRAFT_1170646 [Mycena latifolia]